jgi:hypothetical protein
MKLDDDEPLSQLRQYGLAARKQSDLLISLSQKVLNRPWQPLARCLLASGGIPPAKLET